MTRTHSLVRPRRDGPYGQCTPIDHIIDPPFPLRLGSYERRGCPPQPRRSFVRPPASRRIDTTGVSRRGSSAPPTRSARHQGQPDGADRERNQTGGPVARTARVWFRRSRGAGCGVRSGRRRTSRASVWPDRVTTAWPRMRGHLASPSQPRRDRSATDRARRISAGGLLRADGGGRTPGTAGSRRSCSPALRSLDPSPASRPGSARTARTCRRAGARGPSPSRGAWPPGSRSWPQRA